MLKKPDFVKYRENGSIDRIYCKKCGEEIAGMVPVPKGSGPNIKVMVEKFRRFNNYIEAKIELEGGRYHVTNGCKSCIHMNMSPQLMYELYKVDMIDLGSTPENIKALRVVATDITGVGIA